MKTMFRVALAFTFVTGLAAFASDVHAQVFASAHERVHTAHANMFGGATCGRGISQSAAQGLWDNYCYDECTLHGGCGNGCGAGLLGGHGGGSCMGGRRSAGTNCNNSCGNGGPGACGGACNLGCFGWPSNCGCGNSGCGGCGLGGGRLGHGFLGHHAQGDACGCATGQGLATCGQRGGFLHRHGSNYDACSPITSVVGNSLTNTCGCN
jgi:hypothetical protein